MATEKLKN